MLDFKAYGYHLVMVSLFRYLGRILMVVDNDWPAVISNLRKSQKVWDRLLWIMGSEG